MNGGINMDIDHEIEKWQYEVSYWTRTLRDMPERTKLGRICAEYYLRRAQRKLAEALEKKNNGNA